MPLTHRSQFKIVEGRFPSAKNKEGLKEFQRLRFEVITKKFSFKISSQIPSSTQFPSKHEFSFSTDSGVNVVGCARRVEAIEALRYLVPQQKRGGPDSGRLLALRCDLSKQEDILNMFSAIRNSEFRGVDICINNAGIGSIGSLAEERTEDWQKMVDVNVLALSVCTREALR